MAYGNNRGTLIDNVVYYEYDIINRSPNTYHNFRVAQLADLDLGFYQDDYIGFDSSHRMSIIYNASTFDGTGGFWDTLYYGSSVPVAGVTMVVLPGDTLTNYVPAGSFDYYLSDLSPFGFPAADTEYNRYMRCRNREGMPFINYSASGGDTVLNYVLPGDPSGNTKWSECAAADARSDRAFIIISGSYTLAAGQSSKVVVAFVTTDTGQRQGGCPFVSFADIKEVADTAWHVYHTTPALSTTEITVREHTVKAWPQPAHDVLYLENTAPYSAIEPVTIYNTLGAKFTVPVAGNAKKTELDISRLAPGMYYLQYSIDGVRSAVAFLKE